MSRKDNGEYSPRHMRGKRKTSSSANSVPREQEYRDFRQRPTQESGVTRSAGKSFDYQAFRKNLNNQAYETGTMQNEPEKNPFETDKPASPAVPDNGISDELNASVVSGTQADDAARDDAAEPEITEATAKDGAEEVISDPDIPEAAGQDVTEEAVSEPEITDAPAEDDVIPEAYSDSTQVNDEPETGKTDDSSDAEAEEEVERIDFETLSNAGRSAESVKTDVSMDVVELQETDNDADNTDEEDTSDHTGTDKRSGGLKPKKKSRLGKDLLGILIVILVLIIGLAGTFFVLHEIGCRSINSSNDNLEIVMPTSSDDLDIVSTDKYGRMITYNGVSYSYNDDIVALTLIGVDNGVGAEQDLRMADSVYILAINAKTGETKILGVSRDIMTDVDIYTDEGDFIDTEKLQLAYSYAYHSSTKTGGDNTNKSVSRLFFGLPCKNYLALNLDGLVELNDAVGGVTVTSSLTFKSPEDGTIIHEGDTITLRGKEAEVYVRRRDTTQLESNNDRMQRQQEYIKAFLDTVFSAVKNDITVVSDLYNTISDNCESSLDLPELTYLISLAVTKLNSDKEVEYINLKGTIVEGVHAEMYVSNDELLSTMIDVFYEPVDGETATQSATE